MPDSKHIKLDLPFNGKVVMIESLMFSRDGGHLICVVKTQDQSFGSFIYHLVIYDINTY